MYKIIKYVIILCMLKITDDLSPTNFQILFTFVDHLILKIYRRNEVFCCPDVNNIQGNVRRI
ncbi:hypothetical protein Mgra_00001734 [Meloidogyne graminicola]|uniref:Uncharacterized protein n=1 Tax=Meloidogyne graminicola TaxID=189291 RepID=A0A8T0A1E7_9BILA|nr:hypothetical protein Mgra_00001734 [Meloidogyne graminicola]